MGLCSVSSVPLLWLISREDLGRHEFMSQSFVLGPSHVEGQKCFDTFCRQLAETNIYNECVDLYTTPNKRAK